jgi:hypothetical protein
VVFVKMMSNMGSQSSLAHTLTSELCWERMRQQPSPARAKTRAWETVRIGRSGEGREARGRREGMARGREGKEER